MMVAEAVSVAPRRSRKLVGHANPRISPPVPLRSDLAEYEQAAARMGMHLLPWQPVAARYFMATKPHYREVVICAARQNGKTELIIPRIELGLRRGETIIHTAQDRQIPRKTFIRSVVPRILASGMECIVRKANGQEEIETPNGGRYRIVAPNSSSRGESADLVIIDEVREQHDQDLMDAILPTITARPDAQVLYLTNAGTATSEVLNDLRKRGIDGDPGIAYLEWSAAPEREPDDRDGWAEANPGLGHIITTDVLEHFYTSAPPARFETEHLCRWVTTLLSPVVTGEAWEKARGDIPKDIPARSVMAVKVDPESRRASAVVAWQDRDDPKVVCVRSFAEDVSAPLDIDAFAADLLPKVRQYRIRDIVFDAGTDAALARHFPRAKPLNGQKFEDACEDFARKVARREVRHADDGTIGDDLEHTIRRDTPHGWYAMRSDPARPTTAAEAMIRAVWLASAPRPTLGKVH